MIWSQFMKRVHAFPNRPAVKFGDCTLTFRALAMAAVSQGLNLRAGELSRPCRVLVEHADPPRVLTGVLACWSRGFVPVVLRESMTAAQITEIAEWCARDMSPPAHGGMPAGQMSPRDEGLVLCTSGTTGAPKLVALPAESVCINAGVIGASLQLTENDRVAINTPLGFAYGLIGGCLAGLWAGACCHLFSPGAPLTELQAAIRRTGISVIQGPPSLMRLFLAYWNRVPFPNVRILTTGGEPVGNDLFESFALAFPEAEKLFLYGMTEAGPRISHESFKTGGGVEGCAGVPYPHFDWHVESLPESRPGEGRLVLRGPSLFLGYISKNGRYEGIDGDGFFRTSDRVRIGEDGRLHFAGRLDRVFRSGGRLVRPEDIEAVLRSHDGVADVYCFPESHPLLGLVPVAEVTPRAGAKIDAEVLHAFCTKKIEARVIPKRFDIIGTHPTAESGKRLGSSSSKSAPACNGEGGEFR